MKKKLIVAALLCFPASTAFSAVSEIDTVTVDQDVGELYITGVNLIRPNFEPVVTLGGQDLFVCSSCYTDTLITASLPSGLLDGDYTLRLYAHKRNHLEYHLTVGAVGSQGEKGDTGDTGPQGPEGEQGEKGDTGDTGPQGPQGEQGEKGDTGDTGPQGSQGEQGEKGDTGDTGSFSSVRIVTVSSADGTPPVAYCDSDEMLIGGGGGCEISIGGEYEGVLHFSGPASSGWAVNCYDRNDDSDTPSTAYAICAQ